MRIPAGLLASLAAVVTLSVPVVSAVGRHAVADAAPRGTPHAEQSVGQTLAIRADIVVRHRRLTSAGVPIGLPRPDTTLRLERQHHGGRWKTVVSRLDTPPVLIEGVSGPHALNNPFAVARVELLDAEKQPRLFDAAGRPVSGLAVGDLALVRAATMAVTTGGGEAAAASDRLVVPRAETAGERRAALVDRYGRSTGRIRGYDRYTSSVAGGRQDVLVEPETALPAEILTVRDDGGAMHTGVTYRDVRGVGQVRHLLRTELRFAGEAGRAVTEVEITDLQLATGGRP